MTDGGEVYTSVAKNHFNISNVLVQSCLSCPGHLIGNFFCPLSLTSQVVEGVLYAFDLVLEHDPATAAT